MEGMELDCKNLTDRLSGIQETSALLDRAIGQTDADEINSHFVVLEKAMKEVAETIDPHRVHERSELAKEHGFFYVGPFVNGCAIAKNMSTVKKEYIITEEGEILTGPHDRILPFYEGRTFLTYPDKTVLFDVEKAQISENDGAIKVFSSDYIFQQQTWAEGMITVKKLEPTPTGGNLVMKSIFINWKGEEVFNVSTPNVSNDIIFHDGIWMGYLMGDLYAFNTDGKGVFEIKSEEGIEAAGPFSEGYAVGFKSIDGVTNKYRVVVIDKTGKMTETEFEIAVTPDFEKEKIHFKNGFAIIQDSTKGWVMFGTDGKLIRALPGGYENRSDHFATMGYNKGNKRYFKFHTIDQEFGPYLSWNAAGNGEGYVAVSENGITFNHLNTKGERIGDPNGYPDIRSFSEGLAAVYVDGGWMYIDESGQNPFYNKKARFKEAGRFKDGVAEVRVDTGLTDADGKKIYKSIFIDKKGRRVF